MPPQGRTLEDTLEAIDRSLAEGWPASEFDDTMLSWQDEFWVPSNGWSQEECIQVIAKLSAIPREKLK